MRTFARIFRTRCFWTSTILLASLLCSAQQPGDSQSCTGMPPPAGVHDAELALGKKGAPAANPAEHTIKLSWKESSSPPSTVAGYYIYRRESGPACEVHPNQCKLLNLNRPLKGTGCTDYTVVAGHTYTYQAQTVSKDSLTSTFSNGATAKAK